MRMIRGDNGDGDARQIVNLPPRYEDEMTAMGHVVHVHCRVCGATWNGQWEERPRNVEDAQELRKWERRPLYDGPVLIYRASDGTEYAYRCRCEAGSFRSGLPECPPWVWRIAVGREGPQVVTYAEVMA